MKNKAFSILAGTAVALIALAAWQSHRQSRSVTRPSATGTPVFPSLDVAALNRVASLAFASSTQTVRYVRSGEQWVAPDRFNYPLQAERVLEFLRRLPDIARRESFGRDPATLARMDLDEAARTNGARAVEVTLADDKGQPLAAFRLGKERVRGGMDMPSGRYLLVNGEAVLVNESFADAPRASADWLDRDLLNLSSLDLVAATVRTATGAVVTLRRPAAGNDWAVEGLATNETTNLDAANRLTGLPSYLAFDDVADPATPDALTGLDQAVTYEFRAAGGQVYRLAIGRGGADTNGVFARLSFAFEPPAAPPAPAAEANAVTNAQAAYSPDVQKQMDAERDKAGEEIRSLQARLQPWIFKLPAYRFDSLKPERAAFVAPQGGENAASGAASAGEVGPGTEIESLET